MLALALDMGGSHIACAVVEDRRILAATSLAIDSSADLALVLPLITHTLRDLLHQAGKDVASCQGFAIGFPGIIDSRHNRILSTLKKYEDAKNIDLAHWCRTTFGLPLQMENDARMALLGEQYAGSAQRSGDVVMITLGTGIGGAAMMGGKLLRGAHEQAGSLGGHLPVDFEGHPCTCGNIGCAEAEASGWALPILLREHPGFPHSVLAHAQQLHFRALFDAADLGDSVALDIRDRCLRVWAANVVATIHAYDPELVVMGGGVMQRAEIIVPFVQDHINRHAWTPSGKPEVRAARLGESACLLGAVPLLRETF